MLPWLDLRRMAEPSRLRRLLYTGEWRLRQPAMAAQGRLALHVTPLLDGLLLRERLTFARKPPDSMALPNINLFRSDLLWLIPGNPS